MVIADEAGSGGDVCKGADDGKGSRVWGISARVVEEGERVVLQDIGCDGGSEFRDDGGVVGFGETLAAVDEVKCVGEDKQGCVVRSCCFSLCEFFEFLKFKRKGGYGLWTYWIQQ